MTHPKREPHPFMPPFSERAFGRNRYSKDIPDPDVELVDDESAVDTVLCALSGRRLRRSDAVLIRIGPNRTMWIARDLTSRSPR